MKEDPTMTYEVTYMIELYSMSSPREAAEVALQVITEGNALSFVVTDENGVTTVVDLNEKEPA